MSFKKVTQEEIRFAMYENLIGMPMDQKILSREVKAQHDRDFSYFGEKNGKTLLIICQRAENKTTDTQSITKDFRQEDSLTIKNTGEADKLWNLGMQLTNFTKDFFINELLPNEEWSFNLGDSTLEKAQNLELIEKVSKSEYISDKLGKSDLFIQNNKINTFYFSIFLTNKSLFTITDVFLVKNLPPTNLELLEAISFTGKVGKFKKRINWTIDQIYPNETIILNFKVNLRPRSTNTGKIHTQYRVQIKDDESFYSVKKFSSSLNATSLIEVKEDEDFPANWNCTLSLENRTEFLLDINSIKLFQNQGTKRNILYSSDSVETIDKEKEKILFKTVITSKSHPYIMKEVKYAPQYKMLIDYACNLYIDDDKMDLLEVSAEKKFSVEEIKPQDRVPFNVSLVLRNYSSLPVNHLLVKEALPKGFIVDNLGEVSFSNGINTVFLKNYHQDLISENTKEKYEELTEKIADSEKKFKEFSKKSGDLTTKIIELEKVIERSDVDSSELEMKNKLTELTNQIEKSTLQLEEIDNKMEELNSDLINKENFYNESKEKIEELEKIEQKIIDREKLSEEKSRNSEQLSDVQNKLKDLKKGLKDVSSKLNKSNKILIENQELADNLTKKEDPESINQLKQVKNEIKDLVKEISVIKVEKENQEFSIKTLNTNEKKVKKQIKSIQQKIKKLSIPKKIDVSNLKVDILELKKIIESNATEIVTIKNNIETCRSDSSSITKIIENNNSSSEEIKIKISDLLKNQTILEETLKENDETKEDIEQLDNLYSEQLLQKSRMELLLNTTMGDKHLFQRFYSEFEENINSEEITFDAITTSSYSGEKMLIIIVNNIEKLFPGQNNDVLTVNYSIFAFQPKRLEYKFSSSLFYDTKPSRAIQEYKILDDSLPKLKILETTKNISMGKTIEEVPGTNKFRITLLVKNYGAKVIKGLEIIDLLPKTAVISNEFYRYEENILNDEKKEVVWHIEKIMANEDIEIFYILELDEADTHDITEYELIVK